MRDMKNKPGYFMRDMKNKPLFNKNKYFMRDTRIKLVSNKNIPANLMAGNPVVVIPQPRSSTTRSPRCRRLSP